MNPNVLAYYILHRVSTRLIMDNPFENNQAAIDLVKEFENHFAENICYDEMKIVHVLSSYVQFRDIDCGLAFPMDFANIDGDVPLVEYPVVSAASF